MDPKDDERRTPLFMAASYGANSVVKLLMERDADVTIRDTSLRSMLHAAVGDVKSMEALLQVTLIFFSGLSINYSLAEFYYIKLY